MDSTQVIIIGIQVLTLFASFYLAFFKSYFTEKGKNIATKEDISGVTRLVEEAKHSFTAETEKLKANLSILTNVQVGIVAEERNAIIYYNDKYFRWLNILLDTSLGGINDKNTSELEEYAKRISECYGQFLDSEIRFRLFVEDRQLLAAADDLKIETIERFAELAPHCIIKLKHINRQIIKMREETAIAEQEEKYRKL